MKRILIPTAAIGALLTTFVFAFGDIARPRPTTPTEPHGQIVLHTALTIMSDSKTSEARLQISAETLKAINESVQSKDGSASLMQSITHSSTRTMMAGLFMFLAVSFAGVWLARSNQRRNVKAIAAVLVIAFVFGAATIIVRANAGPPGYVRWQNLPQALKDGKATTAGVDIEIVPGDGQIRLIVPLRNTNRQGE
ncbi:MAG TPA: hypothetical protein VJV21_09090 [Pyrinomonadaceae bacterium]|nr:hypothetical protein [Pyrinomonadaceae bacterium]